MSLDELEALLAGAGAIAETTADMAPLVAALRNAAPELIAAARMLTRARHVIADLVAATQPGALGIFEEAAIARGVSLLSETEGG